MVCDLRCVCVCVCVAEHHGLQWTPCDGQPSLVQEEGEEGAGYVAVTTIETKREQNSALHYGHIYIFLQNYMYVHEVKNDASHFWSVWLIPLAIS